MQPVGGSELAYARLMNYLSEEDLRDTNIILSTCNPAFLQRDKKNVLWQQLSYDQDNVQLLRDPNFLRRIDKIVYVSHWQFEKFFRVFGISGDKCTIIRNGIEPIPFKESFGDKIKLVYTSTPWRGLNVLLDSLILMNRDDVQVDIFSSTKIYGQGFYDSVDHQFTELYDKAKQLSCVNFHGFASNDEVREVVAAADIMAYPNVFEETSCMSAIEALSAGCKVVTTNYGALPETCSVWGSYASFTSDYRKLVSDYTKLLEYEIDNFKGKDSEQSKFYHQHYSMSAVSSLWKRVLADVHDA